jgi:hypothetical protein
METSPPAPPEGLFLSAVAYPPGAAARRRRAAVRALSRPDLTAMSNDRYSNPLTERYASAEMSRIFSPAFKFGTWRRLWLALAEAERELGLPIPSAAIEAIRATWTTSTWRAPPSWSASCGTT